MSQPDAPTPPPAFDGYARLYGPIAVLSFVLSFMPLFDGTGEHTGASTALGRRFGNVYEILYESGDLSEVSLFFGIMLLIAYIGLLGIATFRVTHPALPVTIAVLAALVVIVLLSMLSTDGPARMSYAGMADVALGFATSALTAFHAAHLIHHRNHASAGGG